jgi:hypothetical protein
MTRFTGLVSLFLVTRVAVGQEPPIRDLNALSGKQVIVQRTVLCQPGTFTYSLAYAGKQATVVSLKPSNIRKLPPSTLNRLPPAARALMEDQQRAATILVRFEDGTELDSCAPIGPSRLADDFELAPGQTLEVASSLPSDPTPAPASAPATSPSLQSAATTPATTVAPSFSRQDCPVTVVKAISSNGGFGHAFADALTKSRFEQAVEKASNGGRDPHYLDVRMRNVTQKSIRAIEASVVYANLMGDQGAENTLLLQNDNPIRAGKEFRGYSVDTAERWANGKGDVTVYVNRVRFEDNTFWKDNGSRSCALTSAIKH